MNNTMKKVRRCIIAGLLGLSLTLQGQLMQRTQISVINDYAVTMPHKIGFKHSHKETYKSLALNMSAIALEAIGDGLLDQGRQEGNTNKMVWGHSLQAASVGTLLMKPIIQDLNTNEWISDIVSYTFLRIGTFNAIYNMTRGLPIHYIGSTSLYDKLLTEVNNPAELYLFMNGLAITVGVSLPINDLWTGLGN